MTPDNGCYDKPCALCNQQADRYVHWRRGKHWNFLCKRCAEKHADKVWTTWSVPYGVARIESINA